MNEATPSRQTSESLERTIGVVLRAGVVGSSVCLAAGLLLSLFAQGPLTAMLLNIGILVLLATPVARVFVSIVEYAVERDWPFVALTAIVLLELMASVAAALFFNRKI
jgi:uncharacterized membrane protein